MRVHDDAMTCPLRAETLLAALRMAEHVISGKPYWSVPTFMRDTMTTDQKAELIAYIKGLDLPWLSPHQFDGKEA